MAGSSSRNDENQADPWSLGSEEFLQDSLPSVDEKTEAVVVGLEPEKVSKDEKAEAVELLRKLPQPIRKISSKNNTNVVKNKSFYLKNPTFKKLTNTKFVLRIIALIFFYYLIKLLYLGFISF